MSKHKLAKSAVATLRESSAQAGIDADEAVEALLTWCIEDMKETRGRDHTRTYVQYELESIGTGDFFEIQKR